jgi:hypothetical protein
MGIFDRLSGKPATLTPKSALVLSAITVIAADGVIDEAELNDLAKIVRGDKKSIDTAMQVMKANPFPGVIDLVANVLDESRRSPHLLSCATLPCQMVCLPVRKSRSFRCTWTSLVSPKQNLPQSSKQSQSRTTSQSSHNHFFYF